MFQFNSIKHLWINVKAFISHKLQKDVDITTLLSLTDDELPLHTDGFYNYMRTLHNPFFLSNY